LVGATGCGRWDRSGQPRGTSLRDARVSRRFPRETEAFVGLADSLHGLVEFAVRRRLDIPERDAEKGFEPGDTGVGERRNQVDILRSDDDVGLVICASSSAVLKRSLTRETRSITGSVFGIATTVVTPPAAADRVVVSQSSLYSWPGVRVWT
jgi:hypothetical protein